MEIWRAEKQATQEQKAIGKVLLLWHMRLPWKKTSPILPQYFSLSCVILCLSLCVLILSLFALHSFIDLRRLRLEQVFLSFFLFLFSLFSALREALRSSLRLLLSRAWTRSAHVQSLRISRARG